MERVIPRQPNRAMAPSQSQESKGFACLVLSNMSDTVETKVEGEPVGGKRLGFQFKGTAKRQKIVESEATAQVDLITGIEESNFNSTNPVKEAVLVIPLIQPKFQTESLPAKPVVPQILPKAADTSAPAAAKTLDQIAAAELLADLQKGSADDEDESNLLVIKQTPTAAEVAASQTDNNSQVKKKAPLLMLNVAPELLSITNDTDRFKYDVSARAEDLNVRSEIYDAIPVSQFGAALLRGMGWSGPDKDEEKKKEEKLVAREQRLGLGAQARPPERAKSNKSSNILGKTGTSTARDEEEKRKESERKKWEQKAEQRLHSQRLQDEDVVWLRGPAELSGRRAVVVTAKGVPGLDRVRIQLEHSGRILEVGRKECVLLSADELASTPFVEAENHKQLRQEQQEKQKVVQYNGLKQENESKEVKTEANSNSGGDKAIKGEIVKSEPKHHNSSGSSSSHSKNSSTHATNHTITSSSSNNTNSSNTQAKEYVQTVFWLREGIRVKIVSKSVGGSKSYLQKGTVLDVYARGKASVRLDDRTVIDNVNERHVETIMPATNGPCVVLLGEYKGQHAVCLEKRNDTQKVVVQLNEDLDVVEMDMDSVAATG